ncbi:hypothetical protein CB0940_07696 [Cercospora beticola]|uniref:Uncharacterized protein n=1 Tax=Cercospora beticola TaxID=122368 RepID=A0A2G5HA96_CERBT|nr:hypothetical protein CB0940_07696 [Cercospora beticola]PIA89213.1 hypothetical protein CB0940_07696 [Cercospora beticola]WPB03662.1 hypothetical protein RHO25_008303 [Cercospora beticola]
MGANGSWGLKIWSGERDVDRPGPENDIEVDIILVQGLASDPIWAWRSQKPRPARERAARQTSGSASLHALVDDRYCFWPRDLLPMDIPRARICTYAYHSQHQSAQFTTNISECGNQMLYYLSVKRDTGRARRRPIIFVGHSFGGLALATARSDGRFHGIAECCVGIIFLGTPFRGTPFAGLLDFFNRGRRNKQPVIEALKPDSKELQDLQQRFRASLRPNSPRILVSQESACLPGALHVAMHADHRGMNKFSGSDDPNYIQLRLELNVMCGRALEFLAQQRRIDPVTGVGIPTRPHDQPQATSSKPTPQPSSSQSLPSPTHPLPALFRRDLEDDEASMEDHEAERHRYDSDSIFLEVDASSLTEFVTQFRYLLRQPAPSMIPTYHLGLLEEMAKIARVFYTRCPLLFSMSTRECIRYGSDVSHGVDNNPGLGTICSSKDIRQVISVTTAFFNALDSRVLTKGDVRAIVRQRFLQMMILLLSMLSEADAFHISSLLRNTYKMRTYRADLEILFLRTIPLSAVNPKVFLFYSVSAVVGQSLPDLVGHKAYWEYLLQELAKQGYLLPVNFIELRGDTQTWLPTWPNEGHRSNGVFGRLQLHGEEPRGFNETLPFIVEGPDYPDDYVSRKNLDVWYDYEVDFKTEWMFLFMYSQRDTVVTAGWLCSQAVVKLQASGITLVLSPLKPALPSSLDEEIDVGDIVLLCGRYIIIIARSERVPPVTWEGLDTFEMLNWMEIQSVSQGDHQGDHQGAPERHLTVIL